MMLILVYSEVGAKPSRGSWDRDDSLWDLLGEVYNARSMSISLFLQNDVLLGAKHSRPTA